MKAFLCHSSADSDFVLEVAKHLRRCLDGVFCYEESQRADEGFDETIKRELHDCEAMVIFAGTELTKWQAQEVDWAWEIHESGVKRWFCIYLLESEDLPQNLKANLRNYPRKAIRERSLVEALRIAADIARKLDTPFLVDGLPLNPHLFDCENDIIDYFRKSCLLQDRSCGEEKAKQLGVTDADIRSIHEKRLDGCPAKWPQVPCWRDNREYLAEILGEGKAIEEWQEEFGPFASEDGGVIASPMHRHHQGASDVCEPASGCPSRQGLRFPEAGPREFFAFPRRYGTFRAAILVSGGIGPGINATINAVVERHDQYAKRLGYQVDIIGVLNGFRGFDDFGRSQCPLAPDYTSSHANQGGSILGTSRMDELLDSSRRRALLESMVAKLYSFGIDILYVIGGDGGMKAAHSIWTVAQEHAAKPTGRRLSVVTIPKTMDNDILWVWQSFGFLSAVEEARRVMESLVTEIHSNPRLCIVQLFGSDSGFVVSHAVHASITRQCDAVLIPEVAFSMRTLAAYLRNRMVQRNEPIPRGLVVMAETAVPVDALEFIDEKSPFYIDTLSMEEKCEIRQFEAQRARGLRIEGRVTDALRSASLKIVSQGLGILLRSTPQQKGGWGLQPQWENVRVFTNEPRHLLRAIRPSCTDIIMGNRLGTLAVDSAVAGYTDCMISQWLTEYVLVPLELVVLGRKRIPKSAIFWKSTLAKTGQPADLA